MVWEQILYIIAGAIWSVGEIHAILDDNEGDTFTESVRHLFSYKRQGKLKTLRRTAFVGFWAWVLVHIMTGVV